LAAPAVPLLGHVPAFRRDRLGLLQAAAEVPGDVVELRIAGPAYLLKRAEDVQHVLVARHDVYPKSVRNIGPRARRIFGEGLMTTTDDEHRRMKVRSQPAFRRDPTARLTGVIQRGVDAMLDRWEHAT
jgi:cytochrome P450